MTAPEFSRAERIDTIGARERSVRIAADERERAGLARRFDLIGVERLEAEFTLRAEAGGVIATGRVTGAVVQACSATGEPLPATVDEAVSLRFVPELLAGDEEVELSPDALDTLPIEDGIIDLGEAAAETLALALDPFPRSPDAAAKLAAAGVMDESEVGGPLASALADLKRKLEE
ncbi:YceD family protein [Sphingomonas sp.]|uniref:YceD family protein n=1 Tax=Sphingomonas sp. TaxID=28214 RepID=UPI002D7FD60D|nr:YceD family protein [Sphingomonas sp.]HEU0045332.1 YceD family protein [Sphingomonas sp.]